GVDRSIEREPLGALFILEFTQRSLTLSATVGFRQCVGKASVLGCCAHESFPARPRRCLRQASRCTRIEALWSGPSARLLQAQYRCGDSHLASLYDTRCRPKYWRRFASSACVAV